MKIQKIEDVERPQIGRFYLVPCIFTPINGPLKAQWLPVIGPWHEDADIGTAFYHFHFDLRFFNKKQVDALSWCVPAIIRVQSGLCDPAHSGTNIDRDNPLERVYKRRKMLRETPEFPGRDYTGKKPTIITKLESTFKNTKLQDCLTCPHRGMPLKNLPVKPDGSVVCNGHGLKWNLTSRKLVIRD